MKKVHKKSTNLLQKLIPRFIFVKSRISDFFLIIGSRNNKTDILREWLWEDLDICIGQKNFIGGFETRAHRMPKVLVWGKNLGCRARYKFFRAQTEFLFDNKKWLFLGY